MPTRPRCSPQPEILTFGDALSDFSEAAALLTCLDLLISVEFRMAHLAGALGIQVWVLLQYTPDWRWLLDREDSPWYPTARLFRQRRDDDWPKWWHASPSNCKNLSTAAVQLRARRTISRSSWAGNNGSRHGLLANACDNY